MIRQARIEDLDTIMSMISDGREHIASYNIPQWINGYPSCDVIQKDIGNKSGFVFIEDDEIVGYFVVINHDPCYDNIDGEWLYDEPYVAIHRTVTKYFNRGLGTKMFNEIKNIYSHIRIDTHVGNVSMNKCLVKNDFKYCGVIKLADGSPRVAYEYKRK